jgi:hypothetical protein
MSFDGRDAKKHRISKEEILNQKQDTFFMAISIPFALTDPNASTIVHPSSNRFESHAEITNVGVFHLMRSGQSAILPGHRSLYKVQLL